MQIFVLGLNHKTAPLDVRERLCIPAHRAPQILEALKARDIFEERLVLSTCNRTEIYGVSSETAPSGNRTYPGAVRRAQEFLSEYSHLDPALLEEKLYVLSQPDSVEHLFSVASGLDSMVIGETEITGQVKEAYQAAFEGRQTGKVLNTLFQRSFKVAKNLRSQTGIGARRVSVASVAVDLAEKIFEGLKGARVMVIGTGQMSTQVAKAIVSRGARSLIVSSRHFERAQALAGELGGEALAYENYEERIGDADILIASTDAPRILIHEGQVRHWMKRRHERPLFLIDLAVPRNIDALTDKLDNVYLYNIDDLQEIAGRNRAWRENQLAECTRLVRRHTEFFMDWLEANGQYPHRHAR